MDALISLGKLIEHHSKFHSNTNYWGDSGDMTTHHICFVCGLNLIDKTGKYKTLDEQEEELKRLRDKI